MASDVSRTAKADQGIIEQVARRLFEQSDYAGFVDWDGLSKDYKEMFRRKAEEITP